VTLWTSRGAGHTWPSGHLGPAAGPLPRPNVARDPSTPPSRSGSWGFATPAIPDGRDESTAASNSFIQFPAARYRTSYPSGPKVRVVLVRQPAPPPDALCYPAPSVSASPATGVDWCRRVGDHRRSKPCSRASPSISPIRTDERIRHYDPAVSAKMGPMDTEQGDGLRALASPPCAGMEMADRPGFSTEAADYLVEISRAR